MIVISYTNNLFLLQLQTLPAPVSTVEGSGIMMQDNVAVVLLQTWEVGAALFDSPHAKGPAPIFFSKDPEKARRALEASKVSALVQLNMLMER